MSLAPPRSSSDADWRALYPFAAHHFSLPDGIRLHYVDEGAGEPLLMVHGNPTWSFYWRNLITGLSKTRRAIAVDHVGCGLSDKPQRYPYSLATHTENLCRIIEALDLHRITLLAHDWGGAIGLGAAVALRERFSRLVLFNTAAFPPPFVPWRIAACRLPLIGTWAMRQWNLFARAALTMAVEKRERMTTAVRAGLLAPYDNWANRVAIDHFVRDIPLTKRRPTWDTLNQLEFRLPSLRALPTLMIWGMRDWCFRPSCLERLLNSLPGAEVHRLYDAGHYVVEDAHEEIVPLVQQFLDARPVA